jgi:hypothetical protein
LKAGGKFAVAVAPVMQELGAQNGGSTGFGLQFAGAMASAASQACKFGLEK